MSDVWKNVKGHRAHGPTAQWGLIEAVTESQIHRVQFAAGLVRFPAVSKAAVAVWIVGGGGVVWIFGSIEFPNLKSCSGTHFSQS